MVEEGEVNIMSVELAIQRELAYRRKVATLLSASNFNLYGDLKPLEVQSSNIIPNPSPSAKSISCWSPRLSGIKRRAPANSVQVLLATQPHEYESQIDDTFCKACKVLCPCSVSYKQHINGKKHRLILLKFGEKDDEKDSEIASQRPFCRLCGVWCTNEDNLKAHIKGQKHKHVVAKVENARKDGREIAAQQNYCILCNIQLGNDYELKMHFNGKKHKAELHNVRSGGKDGAKIVKQQYQCGACDIWCVDKESLNSHLRGKRHILKLHGR